MRLPVRSLEIKSIERSHSEMERIGVDPAGILIMAPKQFHYNLKVEGLTPAQANIIKQDMLSAGGEAAVSKGAASCAVETTGAILSGTLRQFNLLIGKLNYQPFGLSGLASDIKEAFDNIGRRRFIIATARGIEWAIGPRTLIMGILNVTPDSFSDGGRFLDKNSAVERGLGMMEEGADWIDVGGESTRPGAESVSVEEELKRVIPVVEALAGKGITVSIDTTKSAVARAALEAGAGVVNDVSGLTIDEKMAGVCAEFRAPVVLMHMRGTPDTMQKDVRYGDLAAEVFEYLNSRLEYASASGIEREKTIIDPGLGFGKSVEGNLELIRKIPEFKSLGRPILIGASRKSFIGKILGGAEVSERLPGSLAAGVASILNGAQILRVHDVREARQAADIADAIKNID